MKHLHHLDIAVTVKDIEAYWSEKCFVTARKWCRSVCCLSWGVSRIECFILFIHFLIILHVSLFSHHAPDDDCQGTRTT